MSECVSVCVCCYQLYEADIPLTLTNVPAIPQIQRNSDSARDLQLKYLLAREQICERASARTLSEIANLNIHMYIIYIFPTEIC